MDIIVFLLMNSIAALSSFFIVYRIFRIPDFIGAVISGFIFYFAQIVLIELILGSLGLLYLNNVIILDLLILLTVWILSRKRLSSYNSSGAGETARALLSSKLAVFCICVICAFSLSKVFINLVNPPFGWDSLNYHFTFAVEWLKHGNLSTPITVFDDPSPTYYPINGSLYYLWLMLPLKNVFLADLGQIPYFIIAFLCVYNIAVKVGVNKEFSFYAACLFLLTPNFFKQLQMAYVDVMVAAFFLACVNFLFLLNEKFTLQNAVLYGLSLGLLIGTKTVALPYSALLLAPFVFLLFKNSAKPALFAACAILIAVFGGFSYIRNYIDTGNPLYPLNFCGIFKGVMDKAVYSAHFKPEDYKITKLLFHEGLGAQSLFFIVPGIISALPLAYRKNRRELDFQLGYFLLLPLLSYLIYRYVIPLANTRYLYAFIGMGSIIGFYAGKILEVPGRFIRALVFISIISSMTELAKRAELVTSIILLIILLCFAPFLVKHILKKKFALNRIFLFSLSIIIFCSLIFLERYYSANEFLRYGKMVKYSGFWPDAAAAWNWLNKNTENNNIAYAGRPVPFPLYGTDFKNNVYYVSVNQTEPAKLHYFPNSRYQWNSDFLNMHKNLEAEGNYRSNADYAVWLKNLTGRNTDYLFVYSLHQTKEIVFPSEDKWAADNPDRFNPVYFNDTIHVYRVFK